MSEAARNLPEVDSMHEPLQLRLIVSIVHWRTPELVIDTLRSIEDELDRHASIFERALSLNA